MHKAIENSIGERRVADGLMPVLDGKLAGDERGAYLVAVLEKFKEVASALLGSKGAVAKSSSTTRSVRASWARSLL